MSIESDQIQPVKCLVWDLDNTVWHGTLLEGDDPKLRPGIETVIRELDRRGVLQSIASRNDETAALQALRDLEIAEYFLHPQINWGAKSESVSRIASALNIGVESLAFIDDEPFERAEVASSAREILCIDASDVAHILAMPRFTPRFITDDSARRRSMYLADIGRRNEESASSPSSFLESLNMELRIADAGDRDLERIEELTVRTSQLNSTGHIYDHDELEKLRLSDGFRLLVADLEDRFGPYGKIGVALIELGADAWNIRLILMSCRVMSRGVGKVMLSYILREAAANGVVVQADMIRTDRNRPMYLTFKMAGFEDVERDGAFVKLEHRLGTIDPYPEHMNIVAG